MKLTHFATLLTGRMVPIFANNKKKRLRQALYASPTPTTTTEDYDDFTTGTSLKSFNELKQGDECFEAYETGPQKQSFPRPQGLNYLNKGNWVDDSLPSFRGGGKSGNFSSACRESYTGNNQGGVQVCQPVKQEITTRSVDSVLRPNSATINNNNESRFVRQFCLLTPKGCLRLLTSVISSIKLKV